MSLLQMNSLNIRLFLSALIIIYVYHTSQIIHGQSLAVFTDQSVWQNFSSEIAYAVGFGYTRLASNYSHKSFPANYSLILHRQPYHRPNNAQERDDAESS